MEGPSRGRGWGAERVAGLGKTKRAVLVPINMTGTRKIKKKGKKKFSENTLYNFSIA